MLQNDPELSGVGLVILDEFHERSLQADLALALLLDVQQGLRDDLRLTIGCALDLGGRRVQVRASIGEAWARSGELAADVLVARADAAMYQAKRQRTGRSAPAVSLVDAAA